MDICLGPCDCFSAGLVVSQLEECKTNWKDGLGLGNIGETLGASKTKYWGRALNIS